jgi:hypothetical protein
MLRAWRVEVRWRGREAASDEVALPHGRLHFRVCMDQGGSTAPADPMRQQEEQGSLRLARAPSSVSSDASWSLLPLRVRGLDRVRLHADLTMWAPTEY